MFGGQQIVFGVWADEPSQGWILTSQQVPVSGFAITEGEVSLTQ